MATYKGKPTLVNQGVEEVYDKVTDIGAWQNRLDTLPEAARAKLGDVKFGEDAILITTAPVGEIRFNVTEKVAPKLMKLEAEQSPVPFAIMLNFAPVYEKTSITTQLEVEIPAMLKPMVGGKLQEAADKMSEMIGMLFA